MAHRKHGEEQELPFVALMDTMTNVVGVLLIVLVMIGISIATAVRKILSDLPDVTVQQLEDKRNTFATLKPIPVDPTQLEKDKVVTNQKIIEITQQLKTIDLTDVRTKVLGMTPVEVQKQIDDKSKIRDAQRKTLDQLLAEIERLKALLDTTPVYKPEPATYVRLPNPRDYPAEAQETRVIVTAGRLYFYQEKDYVPPLIDGLEKSKSALRYQDVKIDPFRPMLQTVFGDPAGGQTAWPIISPLAGKFQMDQVALAYKALTADQLENSTKFLVDVGNISLVFRKPMSQVADAIVAAAKGDVEKWKKLDPSSDPLKPTIRVVSKGKDLTFSYGNQSVDVKATPRGITDYVKTLGDLDQFKASSDARVIYDAFKISEALNRATGSQLFAKTFSMEPVVKPGQTSVQVVLRPRPDGGETLDQIKDSRSVYMNTMRSIKGNPKGVAVFQVSKDAFATYLEARRLADEVGVPATWEFYNAPRPAQAPAPGTPTQTLVELTVNVQGFEVQRFAVPPPPGPPSNPNAVRIAPPKKQIE
jgi:hypothetical protein